MWISIPTGCGMVKVGYTVLYRLALSGQIRSRREGARILLWKPDVLKLARDLREELRLGRAIEHFEANRDLSSVTVADVRRWAEALRTRGLGGGTIRQHLNSVSNRTGVRNQRER